MSSLKTQFITHNPFSTCLEIPPLWRVEDGPFTGFGIRGQGAAEGGWQWTWQRRSRGETTLRGSLVPQCAVVVVVWHQIRTN